MSAAKEDQERRLLQCVNRDRYLNRSHASKLSRAASKADVVAGGRTSSSSTPLHNASMNTPTREEIDAKLAASEARMDARIARIETLMETMAQSQQEIKVQLKETTATVQAENKSTRTTMVITAVSAVITIVVGIAAFNATVLSNMVASFESGKNTANALAAAASALALDKQPQKPAEPTKN